jgi:hypothetical protein
VNALSVSATGFILQAAQLVIVKAANTTTGPATLSVNGSSPLPIHLGGGAQLIGNAIAAGDLALFCVNPTATAFDLLWSESFKTASQIIVNVLDFGADPTGVNDSSLAFQGAINYGAMVYVPAGTYKIASLLTGASGLTIRGAGSQSTIINASTNGFISVTLATPNGCEISGLTINQATASTTGGVGVTVTASAANSGQPRFNDVVFGSNQNNSGSTTGAFSTNCELVSTNGAYFKGCQFTGPAVSTDATTHVTINGTSALTSFQTLFDTCTFTLGTTAIYVGNGTTSYVQGVTAIGCQFISVHDYIGFWDNSTSGFLADSFKFVGCQMASNTNSIYANNIMHVGIIGGYVLPSVSDSGANPVLINLVGCSGVVSSNDFYAGNTPTAIGISISGAGIGGGVAVSGNEFYSFNGSGSMPIQVTGTGNTIGLNQYVGCNANSIAAGNIVADVNPSTKSMTLPTPIILNQGAAIGSTPLVSGTQSANGADCIIVEANTNTSPSGQFLRLVNSGNSSNIFGVDINGNIDSNGSLDINGTATFAPATTASEGVVLGQAQSLFAQLGNANTWSAQQTFDDPIICPPATQNNEAVQLGQAQSLFAQLGTANTWAAQQTFDDPIICPPAAAGNEAVQLSQVSMTAPQIIKYGGGGISASTTYGTTVSFTCPTAGFINVDATWQNGATSRLGGVTEQILINGTVVSTDGGGGGSSWSMYGTAAVSAGTNTVTVQYVVGSTALNYGIFIRALATFLPNP